MLGEGPGEAAGGVEEEFGGGFGVEAVVPRGGGAQDGAEGAEGQGGGEGEPGVAAG